jgi:peptidyl-prolyl cis-trans isomerase A (cyclophilin A)
MKRVMPLLLLPLLFAGLLQAQEDVVRAVREQLRKLRSDEVAERDAAQKKLQDIGLPAMQELLKAAQDSDPDYSSRAGALLKAIADDANPLVNPGSGAMTKAAPAEYKVRFTTSRGAVTVKVTRAWAPAGADRFYNLARNGFYNDCRFFRVITDFACQFGIHGDPKISAVWKRAVFPDDPVKESNKIGRLSFAMRGPNTRTTQVFINLKDNQALDAKGFSPFGEVVEGMDVVKSLYADYGEGAPSGHGPDQVRIQADGNAYLAGFPKLDFIRKAEILD